MRLYSFRQRFIIKVERRRKAKPLYEDNFQSRTVSTFGKKKLQTIAGDTNL
jgi:hypothetical protein